MITSLNSNGGTPWLPIKFHFTTASSSTMLPTFGRLERWCGQSFST